MLFIEFLFCFVFVDIYSVEMPPSMMLPEDSFSYSSSFEFTEEQMIYFILQGSVFALFALVSFIQLVRFSCASPNPCFSPQKMHLFCLFVGCACLFLHFCLNFIVISSYVVCGGL